ncbi:hypothetical protein CEXT_341681 [Caerostris extrusa]|uniref:Uncharacterized protein n=1 Tax=Caerostris extrusa TaxID=172846 RepID=A0AAV4PRR6_CAEEX|nr:hypothetical protein CEXT_341681 [Caerostris extrusa]
MDQKTTPSYHSRITRTADELTESYLISVSSTIITVEVQSMQRTTLTSSERTHVLRPIKASSPPGNTCASLSPASKLIRSCCPRRVGT